MSPRPSPYVGPRAIRTGERLYGRDREVERLFELLLAGRIVLMYSPSGAGKSSLLNAGLIPRLREEGFVVRPTVRVGAEPPTGAPEVERHRLSALLSLDEDVPKDRQVELSRLAGQTLAAYLDDRRAADGLGDAPEVLLFDQFEEVLTVAPTAVAAKQAFFAGLGEALRDERRWAVVVMREDFIAGLDPYRARLPTALGTTFRLDLLGRAAALAAIQGPAVDAGVAFADAAAEKLVNDLRQVHVPRPDGGVETQLGPYVEPVQLQVVCLELWSQLGPEDRAIGPEHLARLGDVDAALANYYDAQVAAAAGRARAPERVLRRWIERHLVTANGLRSQVLQTPETTLELANAALTALVDGHLLRADTRRGMTWLELAHDRIVRPLQESNARWFAAKLSAVQRQAELWDSRGRPESLLLASEAEALRLAASEEDRAPVEREFLAQSRIVRRREAAARRNLRLLQAVSAALVLMIVAGLAYGIRKVQRDAEVELGREREEADRRKADALADAELTGQLFAKIAGLREQEPELAGLLALAVSQRVESPWQRKAALLSVEAVAPQLVARVEAGGHPRKLIEGGAGPLALDREGTVWALDLATRAATRAVDEGGALDVAAHAGGALLAIGRAGAKISLWDRKARATVGALVLPGDAGARDELAGVEALAFSADGRSLVAVRTEKGRLPIVFVVDVAARVPRRLGVLTAYARGPSSLAIAPDGRSVVLVPGSADGTLVVYDGPAWTRSTRTPECEQTCPMSVARFAPDGATLLAGGTGALALWTVRDGAPEEALQVLRLAAGEEVRDLAYLRDGKVAVLTDARISLWDAATLTPWGTPIDLASGDSRALAADGRGELLAVAFALDKPVRVFDPRRLAPRGASPAFAVEMVDDSDGLFAHGPVRAAVDARGRSVAVGEFDGVDRTNRVTLVDATGDSPDVTLPALEGQPLVALQFVGDGPRLAVADFAGAVSAWDGSAWTRLAKLSEVRDAIVLASDARGQLVVAANDADGPYLAAEADGFAPTRFGEQTATVRALGPGARRVALARCVDEAPPETCNRSHIDVHAVASPAALERRLTAGFPAVWLAFGGDRWLAASGERQLRVWGLDDGSERELAVRRELGELSALAFTADAEVLAASAVGRNAAVEVVLWSLATGEELAPPVHMHNPAIGGATGAGLFVSDALVVSTTCDGAVLWRIADDALRRRACALAGRELTDDEQRRFLRTSGRALCSPP